MLLAQLIWLLSVGVLLLVLLFNRVSLLAWTGLATLAFIYAVFYAQSLTWLFVTSIVLASFAVFVIRPARRWLVTSRVFGMFQKILPPISETERAALDAGEVWWEGALFRGLPDWSQLAARTKPALTDEEQCFLDEQTNQLCRMLNNWEFCRNGMDMPDAVWDFIKKEKFFGMIIPKAYGGLGFSALAHSSVVTRICTRSPSTAISVMVPNSLGPAELLLHYGSKEQKEHYLPRLANGEEIPCFGLTATEAGSDAGALQDSGVVCKGDYQGQSVLGIKLNFSKRYITLAPAATLLGVAFKLTDPENLLGKGEDIGITLALLPADLEGITKGARHIPSNSPFLNGPIQGKDVFIPLDMLIGGVDQVGQGWRMLMECLATGRGISLPALSAASAAHVYKMTGAYARIREQFGLPIGKFEGIQEALARIGANTYAVEAMRQFTVSAIDEGRKPSIATAISKYHMTELSRQAINDAMDIHGGKALMEGPKNYMSPFYFSTVIAVTVEGANILTRNLMIFGQGAVRCHPYVLEEITGLADPDREQGIKKFDLALFSHIGYTLANAVRTFALGFTRGWYHPKQQQPGILSRWQRQFGRYSCALAFISDMAMLMLGGDLKRRERLSARLADVLSHLYIASAIMVYYRQQGEQVEDRPYVNWCLTDQLYRIEQAFSEFFANFPSRRAALLLKWLVFPLGRSAAKPLDRDGQKIAESMLKPSAIRERLSVLCATGYAADDAYEEVEQAFQKICAGQPTKAHFTALCKSEGLGKGMTFEEKLETLLEKNKLSPEEATKLREIEQLRLKVISVDQFKMAKHALATDKMASKTTNNSETFLHKG